MTKPQSLQKHGANPLCHFLVRLDFKHILQTEQKSLYYYTTMTCKTVGLPLYVTDWRLSGTGQDTLAFGHKLNDLNPTERRHVNLHGPSMSNQFEV